MWPTLRFGHPDPSSRSRSPSHCPRRTPRRRSPGRLLVEQLEDRTVPNTYTVANLNDSRDGSLRQAILDANANPGADLIQFRDDLHGTIALTSGQLDIQLTGTDTTGGLTITGPGADLLRVDANHQSRVLQVGAGASVGLSGLTLANGSAYIGGGIRNDGRLSLTNSTLSGNGAVYGGGISNGGTLMLTNSTLSGNSAGSGGGISNDYNGTASLTNTTLSGNYAGAWGGGGILNGGTMSLTNTTLSGNSGFWGGGIYNVPGGTMSVTNSTFSGNSAGDSGGGIFNEGTLSVTSSTFFGNSAPTGGGIETGSGAPGTTLTLINSTLSGNSATVYGGGILNVGTMSVTNSTLSGNSAPSGGGIYSRGGDPDYPGATTLANSIVGGNTLTDGVTPSDLGGNVDVVASSGYNLIGPGGSGGLVDGVNGNIVVAAIADLHLGGLADNGGPTWTRALLDGSPAIDAGSKALAKDADGNPLSTDQRGFDRFVDGNGDGTATIDIGAYEAQTAPPVNTPPEAYPQSVTTAEDTPRGITLIATDGDGDTLTYIVVSGPTHGTLTLNADGSFTYTPVANYNSLDSFTFKANDGLLDSNTATVSITVTPVNDAPVNTVPGPQTTNRNNKLIFSSGNGNAISVADVDAGSAPFR
jgi:VCBS repeat-containing protein